jgi:two-component system cell cycle response regulator DivK
VTPRATEILVVDDHTLNRRLVHDLLESEGYRVSQAGTAEEALERARRESPDLILMDLSLPGMSGLEAVRRLKAEPRTRGTVVVVLTAEGSAESALAEGADGFLTKPIDTRSFPGAIAGFLRDHRTRS